MAIDLSKMRAKLDALQNKDSGDNKFWRPSDGEQAIRIVPTEDGDPFREYFFHYNVGQNRGFMCPKRNFGDDCPVCEFASQLWKDGTANDDEEAKKMADEHDLFFIQKQSSRWLSHDDPYMPSKKYKLGWRHG